MARLSTQPGLISRLALVVLLLLVSALAVYLAGRTSDAARAQDGRPLATPLPLYALPDARNNRSFSSSSIALSQTDGVTLVAANAFSNSITIAVPAQNRVNAEVPVGIDPRSVAITPDGTRAIVANRGDGTVSIVDIRAASIINIIPVGVWPYGVVTGNDRWAYVAVQGSGEIAELDLIAGQVTRRFPAPGLPTGLALWGDFLYVTHFWTGEISLVYLPLGETVARASTGASVGLSQSITLDISRGVAYLPQTLSNTTNLALTYDSAALPVVNIVNLANLTTSRPERLSLDQLVRPLNMPFAIAFDRFQQRLYVVSAGSNTLSVVDSDDGRLRGHIEVGKNPRGVLLNRDNTLLFVHNVLDGTLTTLQTSNLAELDVLPLTNVGVPTNVLIGTQFFYSAADTRISREQWLSCANCHFDGLSDGRVWHGFPDGPRNTPLLFGLQETAPYTWSGRWDELADLELKIRYLQVGSGLTDLAMPHLPQDSPHAGLSEDLDALVQYILALQAPPANPLAGRVESSLVSRGEEVFSEQGCADCHAAPAFTNNQQTDVGTDGSELERVDGGYVTPSLRWLWLSAPYFHDGRAPTLGDVFRLPGAHQLLGVISEGDIDALITYLMTLPSDEGS